MLPRRLRGLVALAPLALFACAAPAADSATGSDEGALTEGAAVVTRCGQLRSYGVPIPAEAWDFRPRMLG